jgi:type I restriction enzyme S subunit
VSRETVTLEHIGAWGSGGTPTATKPEYYGGSIRWLTIEDLNDATVYSSKRTITEAGLRDSSAKLIPAGTLLIAMYGASIGNLGIAGISCATNQAIAFCQCDPKIVETRFLFYHLLASRSQLIRRGRGGAQPNISQEILKEFPLSLPPLKNRSASPRYSIRQTGCAAPAATR